jgi:hypothetical protein
MAQHPRQLPPSYEQTRDLQDMFLLPDSYFEVPRYGIDESDESEDD